MIKRAKKFARLLTRPKYRSALLKGVAAAVEHERVMESLRIVTFVDVGANKGQFSTLMKELHPNVTIHAFEPLREAAKKFREVLQGEKDVTLHEMALSDHRGKAAIHVSGRPDSSSLLPISERQSSLFPGTEEKEVREITIEVGDDVLKASDLQAPIVIKLDVQGIRTRSVERNDRIVSGCVVCVRRAFIR
ncbi:FkbM family methyltransferase [Bradyrhizobium sp. LM6.10]